MITAFDTPMLLLAILALSTALRLVYARMRRIKAELTQCKAELEEEHHDKLKLLRYAGVEVD